MSKLHELQEGIKNFVVKPGGETVPAPTDGIGSPRLRKDGLQKVSGEIQYVGEKTAPDTLHAVLVGSHVARGKLISIETEAAAVLPGVVRVLTSEDFGELVMPAPPLVAHNTQPMSGEVIEYEGQPVALVVAETLESAEAGAQAVKLEIEAEQAVTFETAQPIDPVEEGNVYAEFGELAVDRGNFDAGLAEADEVVDESYMVSARHHNMLEPGANVAEWIDGVLHFQTSTQWTYGVRNALAIVFGVGPEKINVECKFTGGGFGAKCFVYPHQIIAPAAARVMGRRIKLMLSRAQTYTGFGMQAGVLSKITYGATKDGTLTAMRHISENVSSTINDYIEFGAATTAAMYSCPNVQTRVRIRKANVLTPTPMRAPHEGTGNPASEAAMDELAFKLGMDPIAFRMKNHAYVDPLSGKPFSSCKLDETYVEGARRFGWENRPFEPRSMPEGDKLIGWGMATAMMATYRFPSRARCILFDDGRIQAHASTNEIGTGGTTLVTQIVGDTLGVPSDKVEMVWGSASLPEACGVMGSSGTMSMGSSVVLAAETLKARILELGGNNLEPSGWPELLRKKGMERLEADAEFDLPSRSWFDADGGEALSHVIHTSGALFIEVEVDEALGQVRMRRVVGCYSAGRVINPVLARSQMLSGIIFGYGKAMLEQSPIDPRSGRYLHKNLSGGALLSTNADIPRDIDISFIEEHDPYASVLGARGIGELCETGVAAAIANAIHHATGKRIRNLPIRIGDLVS